MVVETPIKKKKKFSAFPLHNELTSISFNLNELIDTIYIFFLFELN